LLSWLPPILVSSSEYAAQKVVYGKYYTRKGKTWHMNEHKRADLYKDYTDNTYYIFRPPKNLDPSKKIPGLLPMVLFAFGNGWLYEGSKNLDVVHGKMTPAIARYIGEGLAYVSMAYRSVDLHYWYDKLGARHLPSYLEDSINREGAPEELIHVDPHGRLSLDTTGKTMSDYKARACYQELMVKSIYDAVQAMEHMIVNSASFGLDPHRIFFFASSAGTAEVNYLSYVYHKWHQDRYTPRGMILITPQFDYPTDCAMEKVWQSWSKHVGSDFPISKLMKMDSCNIFVGNHGCRMGFKNEGEGMTRRVGCNQTWDDAAMHRFCTPATFKTATIADVMKYQVWNAADPEVGLGMQKLWYTSVNARSHHPRPFYLYASSPVTFFPHASMYVAAYADLAAELGFNFTVYFAQYAGMRSNILDVNLTAETGFQALGSNYLYRSSFPWRHKYDRVNHSSMSGISEHVMYVCNAFGIHHCGPNGLGGYQPIARQLNVILP
jgi:hypothetical protein